MATTKIAARIDDNLFKFVSDQEGKNFTEKLETVIKTAMSDRNIKMADSEMSIHEKYKYINEINYLRSELETRISIFDESYNYYNLGSFLMNLEFIGKFRKGISSYWKTDKYFDMLYERLKEVYHKAYSAEQEEEKKLYGSITSRRDEFRAIPLESKDEDNIT
ncbi:hypothetical protein [Clostridium guangxiense]|uniref:hypothetical protein n=1 Tax=Clostridium guangxiense TaxID=1662055 RepID=UPI001E2D2608|nr:hypothetical protein [Clostridium guangxiense]MCD2345794.1 hypothetical protein [Clostridium guangxiense]